MVVDNWKASKLHVVLTLLRMQSIANCSSKRFHELKLHYEGFFCGHIFVQSHCPEIRNTITVDSFFSSRKIDSFKTTCSFIRLLSSKLYVCHMFLYLLYFFYGFFTNRWGYKKVSRKYSKKKKIKIK